MKLVSIWKLLVDFYIMVLSYNFIGCNQSKILKQEIESNKGISTIVALSIIKQNFQ